MNRFLGPTTPRNATADVVDVRVSDTHDADEQAACLTDWGQCYEQMSHGSFDGHFESYRFDGIAVESLNKDQRSLLRRHALGFIFQGFNLLARTSALENVELPLLYRGYSRKQRHELARQALASVGLPDKERNTPSELSGGQQQRVAIARAIVTSPGTLFADEPTGNLDTRTTGEVMELLCRLNEDLGITVIMVTHEDDVARYAKRIIHVRDGLIGSDVANPRRSVPTH